MRLSLQKVPSFRKAITESECLSKHGPFDVLVRTVTCLHCEHITSLTSKSYLRVTILLGVAADQCSRL